MKLSEAMMLGTVTVLLEPFKMDSCALGAAANAVGITHENHGRGIEIAERWPWIVDRDGRRPWSTHGSTIASKFNDDVCSGRRTFEWLVDFVRFVEPECGECNRFDCTCVKAEQPTEELRVVEAQ
jgi:hypothetical protein